MGTTRRKIETVKVGETVLKEGFSWLVDTVESFRPSTGIMRTMTFIIITNMTGSKRSRINGRGQDRIGR